MLKLNGKVTTMVTMNEQRKIDNWIAGAQKPPVQEKYQTVKPVLEGALPFELAQSGTMDIVEALKSANQAYKTWGDRTLSKRKEIISQAKSLLLSEIEVFRTLVQEDYACPPEKVARFEEQLSWLFDFWLTQSGPLLKTVSGANSLQFQTLSSWGVTALILPISSVIQNLLERLLPALLFGNVVVVKPTIRNARLTLWIAQKFQQAGLVDGALNILMADGEGVSEHLCGHPGVSLLVFSGRLSVAEKIRTNPMVQSKRTHFLCGGRNSCVIFADADLESAAQNIAQKVAFHRFDTSLKPSRFFIHESIFQKFFQLLDHDLSLPENLGQQDLYLKSIDREKYQAIVDQINNETKRSQKPDAKTHFSNGLFFSEVLSSCSPLQTAEVFGPVVTLHRFKYPHELIKPIEISEQTHCVYLFTQSLERAHRFIRQIDASRVEVNGLGDDPLEVEYTGIREACWGQIGGNSWAEFFSRKKAIKMNWQGQ